VNDLNTELDEIRRTCPIKLPDEPEFLVPDPTLELGRLETIRPR